MTALHLADFTVRIDRLPIVREITLSVDSGIVCALIGANGAGKTTLMRGLMGTLDASGIADFDGINLISHPAHTRAALGIGYMPGDRQLVPELTAEENILLPAWATSAHDAGERLQNIYHLMPEIEAAADRPCPALSGGQQKLVALGRAMMAGRRLLLLDEPFEGLAPVLVQRLSEILRNLKSQGLSILVSESYTTHLEGFIDKGYRIERGAVQLLSN
jgi:branched-chain amino acid transport system ATP-binding protein